MLEIVVKELYSSVIVKAFFLVLVSWWIRWLWSRRRLYLVSQKIPGPPALPILGNVVEMGCMSNHRKILANIKGLMKKYGGFFRLWFGPRLMVCLTEAEDYECILTSRLTYNKGFMYDIIKYAVHEGLLMSSGNVWKKHRQALNPAFAKSTLKRYQCNHNFYAARLVENIRKVQNKGLIDIGIYTYRFSADDVCDSLFDFKPKLYTGEHDFVLNSIHKGIFYLHERICRFWLHNDKIYEISPSGRDFAKLYNTYSSFFHPFLKKKYHDYIDEAKANDLKVEKVESYENLDADYVLEENAKTKNKSITRILAEGSLVGDFNLHDLFSEFGNIFNPGSDTIHCDLSACILLLGMHKRVQDKLWLELKDFYSHDLDAEVSSEHFSHLPYLDMVVKETVRHFPTGPMQMRRLEEDFYLKSRDLTLPAGTQIFLMNVILHRNEKYWKNPIDFYPERFSPEESAKRPFFAFLPYSIGLRNCVGQVFGGDAVRTAVINLIRNFEFTADPNLKMENLSIITDVSTRSECGYKVKITPRNRT